MAIFGAKIELFGPKLILKNFSGVKMVIGLTQKNKKNFLSSLTKGRFQKKKCGIFCTLVGWVGLKKSFSTKKIWSQNA